MKRIAVLNSGGDAPGMNAVVSSVARSAMLYNMPLVGILRGYNGVIRNDEDLLDAFFANARSVVGDQKQDLQLLERVESAVRSEADGSAPNMMPLLDKYREQFSLAPSMQAFFERFPAFKKDMIEFDEETILDINNLPGAYLRTARCDDFRRETVRLRAVINLVAAGVEGLVVVGGDGSFQGATLLCQMGIPCIGIPGTIDNDLAYTEMTLGYDTAVNQCMRSMLDIRATSRSHDRPHVVEVMGRLCGDIALRTAMATGAEILLVREVRWNVDQVARRLQQQIDMGNTRATVLIAEGAYDSMEPFDLYGFMSAMYEQVNRNAPPEKVKSIWYQEKMNAKRLAEVLKYKCRGIDGKPAEVRSTVLGYTQRGDAPTAYDAAFGFEAGNLAVKLLVDKKQDCAIGVKEGHVYYLPIGDAFNMQRIRDELFNFRMYNLVNQL